jgi:hypothetical protein
VEVETVPTLIVILDGDDDDPVGVVRGLVDAGAWQPIDGGYVITPRANPDAATRARQARYRERKRVARVANDATETRRVSSVIESGENNQQPPFRGGVVGYPPVDDETNRADATPATRRGDANDATVTRREYDDAARYRDDVVPLTESERAEQQARVRQLRDELRAARSGGKPDGD